MRRFLPELIDPVMNGEINPGEVFDLTLPLESLAPLIATTEQYK
ncbi:hypothetical protein [Nonomuraea basaltis]|nr:hypothetical protein [Nonomuraea basaltis]